MITEDKLKNVSLSEATMRPEDLIPCFIEAIKNIDPDNAPLMDSMSVLEDDIEKEGYFDTEECLWDLEYLFDTLNALAPEGYYFGAHVGDGSDYGFWEREENI
jgi:hypothetical protein